MAWRWHYVAEREPETTTYKTHGHGYCGAFGKPSVPISLGGETGENLIYPESKP